MRFIFGKYSGIANSILLFGGAIFLSICYHFVNDDQFNIIIEIMYAFYWIGYWLGHMDGMEMKTDDINRSTEASKEKPEL